METHSNNFLVGAFVLILLLGLGLFGAWVAHLHFESKTDRYYIEFPGSVSGIMQGSAVRYRGIPIGTVTDIRIDPTNVEHILVTIDVQPDIPIKADAVATLEVQGLTGGAFVQISGGTQDAPLLRKDDGVIPIIPGRPSLVEAVFNDAPKILSNLIEITASVRNVLNQKNSEALSHIITDMATLSNEFAKSGGTVQNVNGLITELRTSVKTLSTTLGSVNSAAVDARGDFNKLTGSLQKSADGLNGILTDNRAAIRDFSGNGLYQLTALIRDLRELSANLSRLSAKIERDPSQLFFGTPNKGVEVRK